MVNTEETEAVVLDVEELLALKKKNLKKNGDPKTNADPEDLRRIVFLTKHLESVKEENSDSDSDVDTPEAYTTPEKTKPKRVNHGIPSSEEIAQLNPEYKSPAVRMDLFQLIDPNIIKPEDLSCDQRVYLERQLRVHVKAGGKMKILDSEDNKTKIKKIAGGFRKGISEREKKIAQLILVALQRKEVAWDFTLLPVDMTKSKKK